MFLQMNHGGNLSLLNTCTFFTGLSESSHSVTGMQQGSGKTRVSLGMIKNLEFNISVNIN